MVNAEVFIGDDYLQPKLVAQHDIHPSIILKRSWREYFSRIVISRSPQTWLVLS